MACLRDPCQQLVDRLGRIGDRMLGTPALAAHGVIGAIEGMERRVRDPGLVKMQVINVAIKHQLDLLSIVEDAVIGRLRQRHDPRLDCLGVDALQQRVRPYLGTDGFRLELGMGNGANDAPVVPGWPQKDRDGAGHNDRMQDRLVAVAVHDHHIAGCNGMVPHHLVRGRGAVGHEEAVISIEDPRGIAFRRADSTIMIQKLSQLLDRVADIGPQHVLAVELVIHLSDGRFQEGHAA